jgi:hypothetical protein
MLRVEDDLWKMEDNPPKHLKMTQKTVVLTLTITLTITKTITVFLVGFKARIQKLR